MEYKGININIILLIILIVIISFFAGQHLIKLFGIEKPLKEELQAVIGVNEVQLIKNNGKTDIFVKLDSNVDFYNVYNKIDDTGQKHLGKELGIININNNSNKKLEDIYYKLHYYIYEGIATNFFSDMKNNVNEIIKENSSVDYKLWIDNKYVYLQLIMDKNCLYRIIPRKGNIVSINMEGEESSG
jgi:hypothetical protein